MNNELRVYQQKTQNSMFLSLSFLWSCLWLRQEIDLRIDISVGTVIDQIPEVRLWDLQTLALSLEMSRLSRLQENWSYKLQLGLTPSYRVLSFPEGFPELRRVLYLLWFSEYRFQSSDVHRHVPVMYTSVLQWCTHACSSDVHTHVPVTYTGMRQWFTHACSSDVHMHTPVMCSRVFQWCTLACSRRGLFLVSLTVIKTKTESNLWEESVYLAYPSGQSSSLREAKVGTQARQKTGGRNWSRDKEEPYWLASHGLLSLPSCSIGAQGWPHPRRAGPSYINHIQENAPQACL